MEQYMTKPQLHRMTNKDFESLTADCPSHGPGSQMTKRGHCAEARRERYRDQLAGPLRVPMPEYEPPKKKKPTSSGRIYRSKVGSLRIPHEDIAEMKRGKACAICGSKKNLCLDHCHETGKIRGILCSTCNTGLGMMKDNPDLLRKAIDYLGT